MSTHERAVELHDPEFISDPYASYDQWRRDSPVFFETNSQYWYVTRYQDVHDLAKDPRMQSGRLDLMLSRLSHDVRDQVSPLEKLLQDRLLLTDGERHRRMRSLVDHAFKPRQIKSMRIAIEQSIQHLLQSLTGRSQIDLIHDFAEPLPSLAITQILGIPATDQKQFKVWTDEIYSFFAPSKTTEDEKALRATRNAREITTYLKQRIVESRSNPTGSLINSLIEADEESQALTEMEIIANVVGILNAGHETTTNLIGNGMLRLLKAPEQLNILRENPQLIPSAIEEFLRIESPIQFIARKTAEPVQVSGVEIPAGQNVALLLGSANRDPERFTQPEQLVVSREQNRHVAFGMGQHYCIGAPLARLIGELSFAALLNRFAHIELATNKLDWRPYPIFRGLAQLPLKVTE